MASDRLRQQLRAVDLMYWGRIAGSQPMTMDFIKRLFAKSDRILRELDGKKAKRGSKA